MRFIKGELYAFLLIFLISVLFVFDLLITNAQPASFDSPFHLTNIAQFYKVLLQGEFPVRWLDGFANYGLPIPLVSHQLTSYLGALLMFITQSPLVSYKLLIFIGILFSNIFYYLFLRIYFKSIYSFIGTFLYSFSIYRIINVYVRGALPEIFSGIFLPLILLMSYFTFIKRNTWAPIGLIVSFSLLSLTHPMMLLIYSFIIFPYIIFIIFFTKDGKFIKISKLNYLKKIIFFCSLFIIGVGIASYYLIPLNLEIKYFYYGLTKNHLTPYSYLDFKSIFSHLGYFSDKDIFPRGHSITLGTIEAASIILGILLAIYRFLILKRKEISILEFSLFVTLILIFLISRMSTFIYENITILGNIQFQWRMLSALIFFPPLFLTAFLQAMMRNYLLPLVVFIIAWCAFPQLYGKNYAYYPPETYYFTKENMHSILMNTIWSGKSEDYPVMSEKIAVISGKGLILDEVIKNSSRSYSINAETPVRMVDYTFYYPGWVVSIDGKNTPIEYQDSHYRGVITYEVPKGRHKVEVMYENTKIRQFSLYLTFFFCVIFLVLIVLRNKLKTFLT